jgi:pyruvate dehydrogenase E1 component beta subunit
LVPFDDTTILQSVKKTGRLVIVEEECKRGGAASEIAAFVAEEGFDYLKACIKRVASENVPMPYASVMETFVLPQVQDIVKAVEEVV